jgi:DNA invertase Pin-like site-specific DNA recombinase
MSEQLRCAIYARVSTDMQGETPSKEQLAECRDFAAEQGYTVIAEFKDVGCSGHDFNRPGWQALRVRWDAGEFQTLIAWDRDRVHRDHPNRENFELELYERSIGNVAAPYLLTASDRHDSRDKRCLSPAAQNRLKIRENTRRGQKGSFERGLCAGGRAYGYTSQRLQPGDAHYDYNKPRRARKAIDEAERATVELIFNLRAAGVKLAEICRQLNVAGIAPPGAKWTRKKPVQSTRWRESALRSILRNPLYMGVVRWNRTDRHRALTTNKKTHRVRTAAEGVLVREADPALAIVSPELWERANAEFIERPALKAAAKKRGPGPKRCLSSLLICAHPGPHGPCGHPLVISGRDEYRCSDFRANDPKACQSKLRVRIRTIESAVFNKFDETVLSDAFVARVEQTAKAVIKASLTATDPAATPAEAAKLDRRIETLRAKAAAGGDDTLSAGEYLQLAQSKTAERDALLARARVRRPVDAKLGIAIPKIRDRIQGLLARLRHTDNPMQAATVRSAIRPFLADGLIWMTPHSDGKAFSVRMNLDGSALLAEVPSYNADFAKQINERPEPEAEITGGVQIPLI